MVELYGHNKIVEIDVNKPAVTCIAANGTSVGEPKARLAIGTGQIAVVHAKGGLAGHGAPWCLRYVHTERKRLWYWTSPWLFVRIDGIAGSRNGQCRVRRRQGQYGRGANDKGGTVHSDEVLLILSVEQHRQTDMTLEMEHVQKSKGSKWSEYKIRG